jgi:hypothetical protein
VSWSSTCRRCAGRPGPTRGWDGRHEFEDPLRASQVVRNAERAPDRLVRIGDGASAPSADLVAEQPEPSCPPRPDRALRDDATRPSALVWDRCGLDDEPAIGDAYLEGGVEKTVPWAMLDEGLDRLVGLSVQANHVAARTQRDPVEVDYPRRGHGCILAVLQSGGDATDEDSFTGIRDGGLGSSCGEGCAMSPRSVLHTRPRGSRRGPERTGTIGPPLPDLRRERLGRSRRRRHICALQ